MSPRKEAVVNNGNTKEWISKYQRQWLVNLQLTPFTHLHVHVLVTVLSGEAVYGMWYINNLIHDRV